MSDYLPLFSKGCTAMTRRASAGITGGRLVMVSGNGTVATAGATVKDWVGVAGADTASGDDVTVWCGGVQRLVASGAITAEDLVVAAASGAVVTSATPADDTLVGLALSTAADGGLVDVQMVR